MPLKLDTMYSTHYIKHVYSLTFCIVLRAFSTSLWSGWSSGVLFNMARISRGSLVMRCMGSRRKDCMLRCWHRLCFSSLRRYSRNITFFSLTQMRERETGRGRSCNRLSFTYSSGDNFPISTQHTLQCPQKSQQKLDLVLVR